MQDYPELPPLCFFPLSFPTATHQKQTARRENQGAEPHREGKVPVQESQHSPTPHHPSTVAHLSNQHPQI